MITKFNPSVFFLDKKYLSDLTNLYNELDGNVAINRLIHLFEEIITFETCDKVDGTMTTPDGVIQTGPYKDQWIRCIHLALHIVKQYDNDKLIKQRPLNIHESECCVAAYTGFLEYIQTIQLLERCSIYPPARCFEQITCNVK